MFRFKTTPYAHQLKALEHGADKTAFAYLMDMGTGKTKVFLDNGAYLQDKKQIDAMVIVAPKGVYLNWSTKEIPRHFAGEYRLYTWTPETTKKELKAQELALTKTPPGVMNIFCINIEALSGQRPVEFLEKFLRAHRCLIGVDESTTIKNFKALRTKALVRLGGLAPYRRILTGSPITQSPMDIYTQANFLDPKLLNYPSYYAFRARYAIIQTVNLGPQRSFKKVVGYQRIGELADKLSRFSFRVRSEECQDLPPQVYHLRTVEMSPEQAKAYSEMKKKALVMLANGEISSAQIALTQVMRLHQIVCGFLKTDDGEIVHFPNRRLDSLMEVLAETQGKVIIWANYTENIKSIAQAIREATDSDGAPLYHPDAVVEFYGAVGAEERNEGNIRFQDPNSTARFFVGNPACGGMGIDLFASHNVVYYSNSNKLIDRLQSEKRPHRQGQTRTVNYIDLSCPGTVDEKIVEALRAHMDIAAQVVGDKIKDWLV